MYKFENLTVETKGLGVVFNIAKGFVGESQFVSEDDLLRLIDVLRLHVGQPTPMDEMIMNRVEALVGARQKVETEEKK